MMHRLKRNAAAGLYTCCAAQPPTPTLEGTADGANLPSCCTTILIHSAGAAPAHYLPLFPIHLFFLLLLLVRNMLLFNSQGWRRISDRFGRGPAEGEERADGGTATRLFRGWEGERYRSLENTGGNGTQRKSSGLVGRAGAGECMKE